MKNNFEKYKNHFFKKKINFSYKNLRFFKHNKNKKIVCINYSFRIFFFFKLNEFLKKNNFNKSQFLSIMLTNYKFMWYIFLQTKNLIFYYYLISLSIKKYKLMFFIKNYKISSLNILNCYLNFFNIKKNINYTFNFYEINNFKIFLKQNLPLYILKNSNQLFLNSILDFKNKNFEQSKFIINFLRIQRRYNKRRYSKVRVVSRPSFFSGISLSSIFLGLLWGGTIKSVDWITAYIVVVDINLIIFIIIFYFIFRLWRLNYLNFLRKKNKIKSINIIQNMFTFNYSINNDWK